MEINKSVAMSSLLIAMTIVMTSADDDQRYKEHRVVLGKTIRHTINKTTTYN